MLDFLGLPSCSAPLLLGFAVGCRDGSGAYWVWNFRRGTSQQSFRDLGSGQAALTPCFSHPSWLSLNIRMISNWS